ncbi:MAG: histidine kinase [Vicinamibacterales bacterium]
MSLARDMWRYLRFILGAAAIAMLFYGSYGRAHWLDLFANLTTALLFSATIGGTLQWLLPRISPWIFRNIRAPWNWAVVLSVMMAVAAGGAAVSIGILTGIGWIPVDAAWHFFANSMRISLAITLTFGVGVTLYERLRHRADAAEIALRTKERDEAEARRALSEARLASLESRVQPHFLFNTLNSIAALIPEDPAGAERMTGRLASLLRASLDAADSPLQPLAREVQTARAYLEIERVRFGDRLRFTIDVPVELESVTVPRFSLQTLVENSVKFAVAPRRDGGSIAVTAHADAGRVTLIVEDDGSGFDLAAAPQGHGLALLRERLALSYDSNATLSVQRDSARTRVLMTLPR